MGVRSVGGSLILVVIVVVWLSRGGGSLGLAAHHRGAGGMLPMGQQYFCSCCPMEGMPGEGPEAMDVALIWPAIWPMLLVWPMLVAMETLLMLMALPLYMLPLLCWLN